MKFFAHQLEALERGKQGNLALWHEPGCGKTAVALKLIEHFGGPALVVCPLSIIESAWLADCKKFTPNLKTVSLWDRSAEKRRERLEEKADIYVVNYETFKSLYNYLRSFR